MAFHRSTKGGQPQQPSLIAKGHPLARGLFIGGPHPGICDGKLQLQASVPAGLTRPIFYAQRHGSIMTNSATGQGLEYLLNILTNFPMTLMMECVPTVINSANQTIISIGKEVDLNGWAIQINANTGNWDVDFPADGWDTGVTAVVGTQYFMVVTCDTAKVVNLYLNGKLAAGPHTMTQALVNPTVSVGIGCSKYNNGTVIKTFNGFLGRWGIYDRVLAADEVRSLYDNPDQVWSQNARPRFYFASATTQTTPFSFCWV